VQSAGLVGSVGGLGKSHLQGPAVNAARLPSWHQRQQIFDIGIHAQGSHTIPHQGHAGVAHRPN
jgi:hypothetical protein